MVKVLQAKWLRIFAAMVIMLGLSLTAVQPAQAAVIDQDGKVSQDEVIDDDVVLTGKTVVMDGTINGTLIASGDEVVINGTVNGDLFTGASKVTVSKTARINGNVVAMGQTINLEGAVKGSVFGGSASMVLSSGANIGMNLYYGGFSLELTPGSTLGKSVYAGLYQARLNGEIGQDARLAAGAVEIGGKIARNAVLKVDKPSDDMKSIPFFRQPGMPEPIQGGLRIAPAAVIGGKLTYTSPAEQGSAIQAAPTGGIVFQTPVPSEAEKVSIQKAAPEAKFMEGTFGFLRNLVTLLLLGGLALWLLPTLFTAVVDKAQARPLPSAGYGFLAILAVYLGAVLAAVILILIAILFGVVTLGGLSWSVLGIGFGGLGLVVSVFTLLVSFGSKLVIAFLAGRWVLSKLAPSSANPRVWALVAGVVIYAVLAAIPVLGTLVDILVTLAGLGAMWLVYRDRRSSPAVQAAAVIPA